MAIRALDRATPCLIELTCTTGSVSLSNTLLYYLVIALAFNNTTDEVRCVVNNQGCALRVIVDQRK